MGANIRVWPLVQYDLATPLGVWP